MLLIAFREAPGNASYAARRALCDRRLAKRCYEGPPFKDYPWAKRIKDVLEAEKLENQQRALEANRRAMEAQDAEREKARQELAESANQERQILRVARGDVLASLAIAAELVPAMRVVARAVAEACKPDPVTGVLALRPDVAMQLLTRHATLIQRGIGAAEAVIQLSRLERGASTANVDVRSVEEDMSLDDALSELEAVDGVLNAGRRSMRAE